MLITAAAVHQSSGIGKKRGPSTTNGILQRFEVQLAVTEEISQHESCCSTSQQLESAIFWIINDSQINKFTQNYH